jgi:trehalose 6-phosphate phosphatase
MLGAVNAPSRNGVQAEISRSLSSAVGLDIASDFDGTLTPIVATPERARLGPRGSGVLRRLARLPRTRVALLSGRALRDLERHTRVSGILLVGLSGIETRDEHGGRHVLRPVRRLPPTLAPELEAWCERFHGAWVENKRLALAVHDRAVPARRRLAFEAGVRRRIIPYRGEVEVMRGKRVHEIRPAGAPDKSTALAEWRGPHPRSRLLIYLGDDTNDRRALAWVRQRGGIAVAIGQRRLPATHRLPNPGAALDLLEWLERAWRRKLEAEDRSE